MIHEYAYLSNIESTVGILFDVYRMISVRIRSSQQKPKYTRQFPIRMDLFLHQQVYCQIIANWHDSETLGNSNSITITWIYITSSSRMDFTNWHHQYRPHQLTPQCYPAGAQNEKNNDACRTISMCNDYIHMKPSFILPPVPGSTEVLSGNFQSENYDWKDKRRKRTPNNSLMSKPNNRSPECNYSYWSKWAKGK